MRHWRKSWKPDWKCDNGKLIKTSKSEDTFETMSQQKKCKNKF